MPYDPYGRTKEQVEADRRHDRLVLTTIVCAIATLAMLMWMHGCQ